MTVLEPIAIFVVTDFLGSIVALASKIKPFKCVVCSVVTTKGYLSQYTKKERLSFLKKKITLKYSRVVFTGEKLEIAICS